MKAVDLVGDYSYHNYRDCDVKSCIITAEELANSGYYVIRMGVKVNEHMLSTRPNVIDYAVNGMRGDFMDILFGG